MVFKKRTLIIDHYDSFTYLLEQYFGELKGNPIVVQHDKISLNEIAKINPTHIVLSPGPGTVNNPRDFTIGFQVLQKYHRTVPILGVCLGHQGIVRFFGGKIIKAPRAMHGKRSSMNHTGEGILKKIKNPLEAMRYHSLIADDKNVPRELKITAQTKDHLIMAIQHVKYPVFGVQFHPESIGTREGKKIIRNFLKYRS